MNWLHSYAFCIVTQNNHHAYICFIYFRITQIHFEMWLNWTNNLGPLTGTAKAKLAHHLIWLTKLVLLQNSCQKISVACCSVYLHIKLECMCRAYVIISYLTWYSISRDASFFIVWKKHSLRPAGKVNVKSLSRDWENAATRNLSDTVKDNTSNKTLTTSMVSHWLCPLGTEATMWKWLVVCVRKRKALFICLQNFTFWGDSSPLVTSGPHAIRLLRSI